MPSVSPSTNPTTAPKCFGADDGGQYGVLYNAVRSYVSQDCANDQECSIGQTYGWPINSWCVGSVKSMSYLFYGTYYNMHTFDEDINGWDTGSVINMAFM